jgi:hypothetical protein
VLLNASEPKAVLYPPVVIASPARPPMRVLLTPVVTAAPAKYPTAVLKLFVEEVKFCAVKADQPIATEL